MITQPKERTVQVLRSFIYQGAPTKVDARLVLPNAFAHEMRHAGKVVFVDDDPVPVKTLPEVPPNAIPATVPREEKPKGK